MSGSTYSTNMVYPEGKWTLKGDPKKFTMQSEAGRSITSREYSGPLTFIRLYMV